MKYKKKILSGILSVLVEAERPLTTRQVAGFKEISWKTARDNLEVLFELGMVEKKEAGSKRIYWRSNDKPLNELIGETIK